MHLVKLHLVGIPGRPLFSREMEEQWIWWADNWKEWGGAAAVQMYYMRDEYIRKRKKKLCVLRHITWYRMTNPNMYDYH